MRGSDTDPVARRSRPSSVKCLRSSTGRILPRVISATRTRVVLDPMSMHPSNMEAAGDLAMIGGMSGGPWAIEVDDLHKSYGDHEAVRGISFEVPRGEVFGLLGPNGAGKTTTVEILEGYRQRSAGEVTVLGFDPGNRPRAMRERLGIVLQSSGMYERISVREALHHWAAMYPSPRDVDEVIELAGLAEKADARTRTLSGGQLRRLDFALALV